MPGKTTSSPTSSTGHEAGNLARSMTSTIVSPEIKTAAVRVPDGVTTFRLASAHVSWPGPTSATFGFMSSIPFHSTAMCRYDRSCSQSARR